MLACSALLLLLAPQLPAGTQIQEDHWLPPEVPLVQREGAATLWGDDVIWTRTATQPALNEQGLYVDLYRTERIDSQGQVIWSDSAYGSTFEGNWPVRLGRMPASWPVDTGAGVVMLALHLEWGLLLRALDVDDGSVVWETFTAPVPGDFTKSAVVDAYFDPSNQQFLVVFFAADMEVRAIDAATGDLKWMDSFEQFGPIFGNNQNFPARQASALSPDGTRLAVAGERSFGFGDVANVRVYDTTTGNLVWTDTSQSADELALAIAPDGQRLALATRFGSEARLALFQLQDGTLEHDVLLPTQERPDQPAVWFDPSGARVLASYRRLQPSPFFTEGPVGVSLFCSDATDAQLLWSVERQVTPESIDVTDYSFRPDVAFPRSGELLWAYSLQGLSGAGTAGHRERLSLADGAVLQAANDGGQTALSNPDMILGADSGGDIAVLVRDQGTPVLLDERSYEFRVERLDPVGLDRVGTSQSPVEGIAGASVLELGVSADGTRAALLTSTGVDGGHVLAGLDAEQARVIWEASMSPFPAADRFEVLLDPAGARVALIRTDFPIQSPLGPSIASVFDMQTGALLWELNFGDFPVLSAGGLFFSESQRIAALREDALIIVAASLNESVDLAVLEPGTGQVRWSQNLDANSSGEPYLAFDDTSAYALSREGSATPFGSLIKTLRRFDLADGQVLAELDASAWSSIRHLIASDEGLLIAGFQGSSAYRGELWSHDLAQLLDVQTTPVTSLFELSENEGLLGVVGDFFSVSELLQLQDVLDLGEDPGLDLDWSTGDLDLDGRFVALFDGRRQLYQQDDVGSIFTVTSTGRAFDLGRGGLLWEAEDALTQPHRWRQQVLADSSASGLFTAFTAEAPGEFDVPFRHWFRRVETPDLLIDSDFSLGSGGRVDLYLRGESQSPDVAADLYFALASFELASPGIPAGSFEVPFAPNDPLLFCTLMDCDPEAFVDFRGVLTPPQLGYASVQVGSPVGPELQGLTVHFTWVQVDGASGVVESVAEPVGWVLE